MLISKKMDKIIKKVSFWVFVSAILFLALVLVVLQKPISDGEIIKNKEEVAEITVNYINDVLLQGIGSVELIEALEERGVYKIRVMFNSEEIDVHATKDGKLFFPEAFDMEETLPEIITEEEIQEEEIEQEEAIEENLDESSDINNDDVGSLIDCLKVKNFVIYGAEWCPYCRDLVNLFNGHEKTNLIYVECTENENLCNEKNITGYPTILINNQPYNGERSLETFATETGC